MFKLLLDGPQVSGDPRGWYATLDQECVCQVWHPKDDYKDPEARSIAMYACSNAQEALDWLFDEDWIANATTASWTVLS